MFRALVLALVLASPAALAHADVIEDCPEGQHFQGNPVEEGAMHHGGGRCVDDPGRGGCAVGRGAAPAGSALVLALASLALAARRRRR